MRSSLLWILVTITTLCLQARLGWPLVSDRLAHPCWWPLLAVCLVSFALILRRLRVGLTPEHAALVLFSLSLAVTFTAFLRGSIWLYLPAFWLTTWALTASAHSPTPAARSSVVTFPLLLFAGFPPFISTKLSDGLLQFTSQQFLLYQGVQGRLAWLDESTLFTSAGSCQLEATLLSPFGLPLLIAGSCLLAMVLRRSLVQTLLLTGFGAACCLLLQAATVWLMMLFPNQLSTTDGTPGWLGSLLLVGFTSACILIAQSTVLAFTTPITAPEIPAPDSVGPWVILWDHFIGGQPIPAAASGSLRNVLTEARMELRLTAIIDAVWSWWYTRNWLRAGLALLLTAVIGSVPFMGRGSESQQRAISLTEATADSAELANRPDVQEQALRMLVSLQPTFGKPRLQLAELLWKTGRIDESRQTLNPLVTQGPLVWAPARLWLVQNSLQPEPLIPLDDEARIQQLRAVLQESPGNGIAASLLSQMYMTDGEASLAEKTLIDAVAADPTNAPLLLAFCTGNNRPLPDPGVYQRLLQDTRTAYLATPTAERTSAQVVPLAQLLLALGRIDEAFQFTTDARRNHDSPELQQLEATVRLRRISQTATREFISPRAILDDLEVAMSLQPDSETALELATLLTVTEGARLSPRVLETLTARQQQGLTDQQDDGRSALISFLHSDWAAAVTALQKQQPGTTAQQLALVSALRQTGRSDLAAAEARRAQQGFGTQLTPAALNQTILLQIASGNLQMPEYVTLAPSSPEFLLCTALLDQFRFDQLCGYPGDLSPAVSSWQMPPELQPATVLRFLEIPLRYRNTQAAAARRLYRLRRSSGNRQAAIDLWLQQMRATLGEPGQMLLIVGTMAVLDEAWDEAIYWLDAANRSSSTLNPVTLNNLAIAIVRARRDDRCAEALTLIEKALTLLPDNPDLLASRAEIHMALKDGPAALNDLREALKLQPDHQEALRLTRLVEQ